MKPFAVLAATAAASLVGGMLTMAGATGAAAESISRPGTESGAHSVSRTIIASIPQSGHQAPTRALERTTMTATRYARQARTATNNQRARRDLVRLRGNDCLQRKAVRHARRMANQRRIFHQDPGAVLRDCNMRLVGENVAVGFPTGWSVVNRGWMNSDGHRANILRREFRRMGLAARKADGRWYVAQVFGRS